MAFDFDNLPKVDLNLSRSIDMITEIQRENENAMRAIALSRKEKDKEDLRRHNELVSALKEAGEKGATIIIGDNAKDVQIQQNSNGSNQTLEKSKGLNYEQVKSILTEIKGYYDFPQFDESFGSNSENIKLFIDETLKSIDKKEDENLIKKSLRLIKEIAINTSANLISSGIMALLGTLPI